MNEAESFDEPIVERAGNNKSRKSLDYGLPVTSKSITQSDLFSSQTQQSNSAEINLNNSFDNDFHPITNKNAEITRDVPESAASQSQALSTSLDVTTEPLTKKRTIEELFGDIDDLLFENERKAKKIKPDTKLEQQMEMIDKILELRKQREESDNILFRKNIRISSVDRDKLNLSWRVPTYPFIKVTRPDKETFFIRCHSDDYEKEDVTRVINDINLVGVMGDMFKETWEKAQQILNRDMDDNKKNEDVPMDIEEEIEENNNLWVDLYKPRRYLELLSDEATNRVLLKWLKLWDNVVFNRKPKVRPETLDVVNKGRSKFNFFNVIDNQLKLDEDGRPLYKVALLCGRPGLGKTTLAHVVAKHAGYNVVEINASDDRSLESFKTSLENSTQMRSVIGEEKRPNCVIFDEIDGAPVNSVEFLVKFVSGTVAKKKKKEKGNSILKRPIICICNDAYVPALRSLRQIAFIINFPPTSSGRLSERLMEICKKQLLQTDAGSMLALAEKSNNDIRSCLSILHFFKTKRKTITLADIYQSSVGQKDMQKGLFSVWSDIFSIERAKMKFSGIQNDKENNSKNYDMSFRARMQKVLDVVQSFGDYERLAQGVFENFPHMQIKEASFVGICHALNWFCYTDKINRFIMSQQNFSLSSYLPYAFVVWHFQFSSLVWPKLKYPNEGFEVRQKRINNLGTVKEVIKGVQPTVRVFVNAKNMILDTLPLLTRIINPFFRPVNFHLFTNEEKGMFLKVVNIMIDYNLNYIQEKNAAGIYEFKLDPDIMPIVMFPNVSESRIVLSYFNKQLLSREVEMEKIRKIQKSTNAGTPTTKTSTKKDRPVKESPEDQKLPNHLQRLKIKSLKKIEPAVTKDFFGRIIKTTTESNKGPQLQGDIWYKYKEGYSNAVRKKIKMSSLM